MKRLHSWLAAPLLALFLISLLTGCAQPATPSSATPAPTPTMTAQEITANAVSSFASLKSFQSDISMSMIMTGLSGTDSRNINITATGNLTSDIINKKMLMNLSMNIEVPGQGNISLPITYYSVDNWQYIKISAPVVGTQWLKLKVDANSFDSKDQSQQLLEMLKTAISTNVTGFQNVAGTTCYVLQVNPDLKVLSQWIESFEETANLGGSGPANIDLSKFVKNLSITEYITRDGFLLKKSDISATVNVKGADLGAAAKPGDYLNLDIKQTLTATGYNQPVNIVLPPEAQVAQDVTPK